MKTTKSLIMAIVVVIILFSQSLYAQDRLSIEFRPSVNLPTSTLGGADLNTGYGFEGTVAYRFLPHFGVYAGWGWNKFSADLSFAGPNVDFEETGYTYGLMFLHPIGNSRIEFLARLGALSNHIEVENSDGEIIADSGKGFDAGIGWQAEGGFAILFGDNWRLLPSVRYRSLPRDLEIGPITHSVTLQYLSLGLGISKSF